MKFRTDTFTMRSAILAGVSLLSLSQPAVVWAQESDAAEDASDNAASTLETIYVSARRIEESLQDAPLAISAFTGADLDERGLDDLTEIARSTPGFSFENFNGAFATPVIRGQSQNRLTNPVQNVATFYNGVHIPRGYMIDASLLNIGQVEVLRGPQSAALGRNAYAGAINFITRTPGDEFDARLSAAIGENDYQKTQLTIEGALVPGVLSLIAGYTASEYDGAWENNHALANASGARTSGNLGGFDAQSWMAGAYFTPIENLDLKLTYLHSERDIENPAQYSISGTPLYAVNTLNCSPNPVTGANRLFCGELSPDPVVQAGETRKDGLVVDPRTGLTLESDILSLEVGYQITSTLDVAYLYGFAKGDFEGAGSSGRDPEVGYNGPAAPFLGLAGANLIDTSGNGSIEATSHELRLTWSPSDNFTGYVGGFYSESDDLTDFALINVPAQTVGPLSPGVSLNFPGFADKSLNAREVTSLFALISYDQGPWSVSVEGRYTEEDVTETNQFVSPETSATRSFDYFTPRLTAGYEITSTNRIYASFASGTKAGGFNVGGSAPQTFGDPDQVTFEPEENDTFEFGSRNELLDNRLILNGTLYFIDATNIQVSEPRVGANGTVIGNRAAAETWGLELDASFDVSDNLNLYGAVGYANAEYGDGTLDPSNAARCDGIVCVAISDPSSPTTLAVDISGNQLERTPKWTTNLGFRWDGTLSESMDYFLRGNLSYQDKQYTNSLSISSVPERTILDAAIGVEYGGLTVTLSADNLLDEQYVSSAFEVGFLQTYSPNLGDRRRVVLAVDYDF